MTLLRGCFSRFLNCTNGTKWLKTPHINLTLHSVTRVNLKAQILNEKVGNVLNSFGPEEAAGNFV